MIDGNGNPNLRAGGVSLLVDKRLLPWEPNDPSLHKQEILQVLSELVPGRAVRFALKNQNNQTVAVTFVHNYGLTTSHMDSIEKSIKKDKK